MRLKEMVRYDKIGVAEGEDQKESRSDLLLIPGVMVENEDGFYSGGDDG